MRWLTLVPVCLLSGCIYQDASEWKRCSFDIASVHYAGLRENQTEWEIALDVHNPNPDRLKMQGVQLFALSGKDTLATLHNQKPLDIDPNATTRVALNAESPSDAWNKALSNIQKNGKCSITVTGDAFYSGTFGMKKYPNLFHKTYDLDLATALNAMGSHLFQGLQGLPFSF